MLNGKLIVFAYKLASSLIKAIPNHLLSKVSNVLGRVAYRLSSDKKVLVKRNMLRVHKGQITNLEIDQKTKQAFVSYAKYWIDSAKMQSLTDYHIDAGFTVEGFEHIENAWSEGPGPILALPHLGGWEWAGRWLTCRPKFEVTVVVEPQQPKELFEFMMSYRESFGMNVIPLGPNAGKEVIKAIKSNHVVCLLCDRDIEGTGVKVSFFGEETTIPAGPATLSIRTGAKIIPVAVYQRARSHHAIVKPPLNSMRQGSLREDVARISQKIAGSFEELILLEPEQWHLMSPNWPSDH
ncbi:MAG: phosphatidylinositol mannoside acyltransferase [Actinobacteria bacterium]|nr:phosphatidylinositol mannoside acyltransferase [Actinomycetota bacterium]MAU39875.1 phosphatidylinositol mannoside acyltransferase [Actinomycetota bacterium]